MRKLFCIILILSPIAFSGIVLAQRSPAVSPITEIAVDEDPSVKLVHTEGFDFRNKQQNSITETTGTEGSAIPMMFFLMALPIMIWIGVMQGLKIKKRKEKTLPNNIAQFPKREKKIEDEDHFKKAS